MRPREDIPCQILKETGTQQTKKIANQETLAVHFDVSRRVMIVFGIIYVHNNGERKE
jgi:hypothetical protein